jgi:uncharacterized damage-inducible protein DinB
MDTSDRLFLDCSARRLRQTCERIEDCLRRLDGDPVWARGAENENAVGNLVLHLAGNVRQWILGGVGGQPDLRDRDGEFAAREGLEAGVLSQRLHDTVAEAIAAIEALPPARLTEKITVQNYDLTVLEAIYHVVEHFSGHAGQIIFATKLFTGEDLGYYRHLQTAARHGKQTP